MIGIVVAALLAGPYRVPGGDPVPVPDASLAARIERGLASLRGDDPEAIAVALRDLALAGDAALPALVARLNEAEAGERILLLLAGSRFAAGAALLGQAALDPDPSVRALALPPHPPAPRSLDESATRYLEALSVAEPSLHAEALLDLRGLRVPWRPRDWRGLRPRLQDRALAAEVLRARTEAATEFGAAAAAALRAGRLGPDLADPCSRLLLSLLREEGLPFYFAATGVVAAGDRATPAVESLLGGSATLDPILVRLLSAMRSDGGRGLYDRLPGFGARAQQALLEIAPPLPDLEAVAARAFREGEPAVRIAALDLLLRLPPPAGADLAGEAFGKGSPSVEEISPLFRLAARAGREADLALLRRFAETEIADERARGGEPARRVRAAAISALHEHRDASELALRWIGSDSARLRSLGIGLASDAAALLACAALEPDPDLAASAVRRALDLGAPASEALPFLRARGDAGAAGILQALRRREAAEELLEIASSLERLRLSAIEELSLFPAIAPVHETRLLALHDGLTGAARRSALGALLPLGTPTVRERVVAAGASALEALARRARAGLPIPFPLPLLALLPGLDPAQARALAEAASALPEVEPGLYLALLAAVDATPARDPAEEEQRTSQRRRIGDDLALSTDVASAEVLFARLLEGKSREPKLLFPTLKAAARLLPAARLEALLPLLGAAAEEERARPDRTAPLYSEYRHALLLGGVRALGWARAESALAPFCRMLLDPALHPAAFARPGEASGLPRFLLDALRLFPAERVEAALRGALSEAEASGDLAKLHPEDLLDLARACHQSEELGRRLHEVALLLCDVAARSPWPSDVSLQRARALSGLQRRGEAAAALRRFAQERIAAGAPADAGWFSPERLMRRAALLEAVEARDVPRVVEACGADPELENAAAQSLFFLGLSVEEAERLARSGVRGTAGLHPGHRDTLAGILVSSGRAEEAHALLESSAFLRERLRVGVGWHLYWSAKAHLLLGRRDQAESQLQAALLQDRAIEPYARADAAMSPLEPVFRRVEEAFFDTLFSWEE